ncbi:MAG: DNA-protecting protein DprA [Fimbriimonadaceae bacterium]|nr:DNA-protecting protein DprA [Fimbriimonadaceae bacterium]QYK58384.1 MAG: DNA-protecting protein DprA [Fimbriimonadaceae bacterium]
MAPTPVEAEGAAVDGAEGSRLAQRLASAWVGPAKARRFLKEADASSFTEAEASRFLAADVSVGVGPGFSTRLEPHLPEGLNENSAVRPWLFVQGRGETLDKPMIAIVGTRTATTYGQMIAAKFSESFAQAGVTVVSGGAPGIDAAAHAGSLKFPDSTVCVLPCGADRDYPARHRQLLEEVRSKGCTVSQYAWGSPCLPKNTAERDTLIAALAKAVVVIEAPAESGSLITAQKAKALGRPIFVVPGPVTASTFLGSHRLIREGAELVWEPEQVLGALGLRDAPAPALERITNGVWRDVAAHLEGGPLRVDHLAEALGMPPSELLVVLTEMEIEAKVKSGPEGYSLVW